MPHLWFPALGAAPVVLEWTFESGASAQAQTTASVTNVINITPNTGDLLVLSWWSFRASQFTGVTLSDTGSGGWTFSTSGSVGGYRGQLSWKVATSSDYNGGSGIAITCTATGGSGAISANAVECDVFRPPTGSGAIGVDLSHSQTGSSTGTAGITGSAGSGQPANTDQLSIASVGVFGGPPTGTNTFTGTSPTKNLNLCLTPNDSQLMVQYVAPVQCSATVGSNTWVLNWTSSQTYVINVATFYHT